MKLKQFSLLPIAFILSSLLFCEQGAAAAAQPPIDRCPVGNHFDILYGATAAANDYCHCYQNQALENCKRINGENSWMCHWGVMIAALKSANALGTIGGLCGINLGTFRSDPNYVTYYTNCVNETNYFFSIPACSSEV